MRDFASQVEQIRKDVLAEIRQLLPAEQTYVNLFPSYCSGVKYLGPGDELVTYQVLLGQINPFHLEEMPVEALVDVLRYLRSKRK